MNWSAINLRLLALSDIHGLSSQVKKIYEKISSKEIDAVIACGDLTYFGTVAQAKAVLEEIITLDSPLLLFQVIATQKS